MDDCKIGINSGIRKRISVHPYGFFNRMKELGAAQFRKIQELFGTRHVHRSDPPHPLHAEKSIDMTQLLAEKLNAYYMPQKVSLGPSHPLPETENYKYATIKNKVDHDRLVNNMIQTHGLTSRIRQFYDSSMCPAGIKDLCQMSDKDLCQMMALDGFFLLQFLSLKYTASGSSGSTAVQGTSTRLVCPFTVQEDIMKLANQIPLFVLQNILQWETSKQNNVIQFHTDQNLASILKEAWRNLSPIQYSWDSDMPWSEDSHLLQFVYENIIRPSDSRNPNNRREKNRNKGRKKKREGSLNTLPTAVELKDKGVSFAPNEGLLREIRFDYRKGKLYLPVIEMDNKTDSVLRNLMAFEASKQYKPALMRYVDLMDRLINTANDVAVLKKGGVIQSHMGNDDDVANVWNALRDVVDKNNKYAPIDTVVGDVMAFSKSRYKNLHTEFKRRYCSKPWLVISVISACILLALTVLQTLLSWEQVLLQRKSMNKM